MDNYSANSNIALNPIPKITVKKMVKDLSSLYINIINKKLPYNQAPAPFLWGPPGVGKSEGVEQIAREIEKETDKEVHVIDVRLLLFSPIDLRGVPVASADRQFTDWLMPRIFDMDKSDDVVNLLFLDELSAAPQSVQAAAYQLVLNRKIGEHSLPENTFVIAAGNRTTDRAVSFKMPSALANRLLHMELAANTAAWLEWAKENGVNPTVVRFLTNNGSWIYKEENLDHVAFPSPRSWVFVSNILNTFEAEDNDLERYFNYIAGCIGSEAATVFMAWSLGGNRIPPMADIFDGSILEFHTKSGDVFYTLETSMADYAKHLENKECLSRERLEAACNFAINNLPAEYVYMFWNDLSAVETIKTKLMACRAYTRYNAGRKVK
ncbi:MAG: AAA family ATPase [Lachnospiraceae bacterium]|nr:AAA family ATPase [Lachnospiraceae bacterium]